MHNPCKLVLAILAMSFPLAAAVSAQTASGAASAVRYGFAVDWSRDRVSSKDKTLKFTDGDILAARSANTYVGHAKVTNRSSAPLENLEVQIQMHYKVADGKNQRDEQKTTKKTIASIRTNETVIVDTDPLALKFSELKGGFYYTDGTPVRQADSIRGAIVTLFHDGKQVFEYVSSPALKSVAGKAKPVTSASSANK